MKRIVSILGVLAGSFSCATLAAELTLPRSVELLALDGQKVAHTAVLQLPEGKHQFVFRYEESLRFGSRKKKYQSMPLIVSIPFSDSAQMALRHSRLRDYSAAESAFKNGTVAWQLSNSQGKLTELHPVELPGNPGFLPYQNIEAAIGRYNRQHGIPMSSGSASVRAEQGAATPKQQKTMNPRQTVVPEPSDAQYTGDFVPRIQAWYLHATDAERKALLKWMIEQQ
ncbi:DUF2057 domain-containing protein [Vibrio gazogenes]|uniref:Uncharacterized conserved protein YccT, UPF0319 family n=1 Tax=Vibrio gazogenes DSM 21264 = NBRC 103151 TaxID=1123492 RepID=A0A1M5E808_VIBGA|nr:DUF2057 domain-containing protein [Vibrio gazogenes]USP14308.1 DUF2057 domain-containing protein [Vibrio gazogenes]SHF75274.1 Uncharacterized conserved protein YccT, UPF0319 family [Vibrio gazogenes DSM 21264] [Vibrio gazogenes DSM 21264 = NBRC 103151]SJN58434.1 hypothetical protein BQ6471_03019 [Vibrio gazogenes]